MKQDGPVFYLQVFEHRSSDCPTLETNVTDYHAFEIRE
jgi:hypothetical protein